MGKEADPNQPNSKVSGSRKNKQQAFEGVEGETIFCGGPGFKTDLKHVWDWL